MSFSKAEFEAVKIGSIVGTVTGPGEYPKSRKAIVTEKVETKWGFHLVCKFLPGTDRAGSVDTCSGFTKVGIGWYLLEEPK